jgi:hypothetical protein
MTKSMEWIKPDDYKKIKAAKRLLKKAGCTFSIFYGKGGLYYYDNGSVAKKVVAKAHEKTFDKPSPHTI